MPGTLTKCPACGALANPAWMTCGACTAPLNGSATPAVRGLTEHPRTASPSEWLSAWRELAEKTAGLLSDDLRLGPVLEGLARCDEAFLANDYPGFLQAKAAVLALVNEVPRE